MESRIVRLLQIFSAKLVLEVFGGAGAIWGFSEAVGLRKPDTLWFWRPCALVFGAIFFIRWMMQIQDYLVETRGKMLSADSETLALTEKQQEETSSYGSAEDGTGKGVNIIV